jgi:tetratricopeptide (TPR) repeat protein/tRNA A-37 threonylcarbamoyl transferase component Bud32
MTSHYRVLHPLGEGGMGEVYAGFDETLQRRVAMKAIRAEQRLDAVAKARFLREARILSQLDHPHVCRVYDFIEDEDAEWLVLELIEGKSLQVALRGGLTPAAALSIAEQIADALSAAHRAGVVHRDLKPANVMLTRGDVVKVLDFGLAQSGEYSDVAAGTFAGAPAPRATPPEDAIDLTRTSVGGRTPDSGLSLGTIVGTPAYMSPEQARAEPATPASDMYSFGLMLQEMMTGRSAYPSGIDYVDVIELARQAKTEPVAGISGPMASLITTLKAADPAARPTAVETVARLRWIRDTPRRRLRHAAIAALIVAAAGGAVKYTYDLARERTIAVAARDEANRRRGQAEDLIRFMLGDLRKSLEPVGRLDVLDGVGAKAMAYFAAVPPASLSDEELLRRSTALYQIGEVRIAQGNLEGATAPLEESLALAQTLVSRQPTDGERVYGLAQSQYWAGFVHFRRHNLDQAERHFSRYLDAAQRLLAIDPARADWQRESAYANSNLGSVLQARGDLDGALARFRACLAVEQVLSVRAPEDRELAQAVASSHNAIGLVLRSQGQLSGARREFEAQLAMQERLHAAVPGDAVNHRQLGISHAFLGDLLRALGDVPEAHGHFTKALLIAEALSARDPTNRLWQQNVARYRARVGLTTPVNQAGRRRQLLDGTVAIMRSLTAVDPTHPGWTRELAESLHDRGTVTADAGDMAGAEADADAAIQELDRLQGAAAADRQVARARSLAHALRGRVWQARRDAPRARAAWTQALAAIEPAARNSSDYQFLDPLARALIGLDRTAEAAPILARLHSMGYRTIAADPAAAQSGTRLPSRLDPGPKADR